MKTVHVKRFKAFRFLCGGAVISLLVLNPVNSSHAQNAGISSEELSAELDFLPPQPTETVLPNEDIEEFSLEATTMESQKQEESVDEIIKDLSVLGEPPKVDAPSAPLVRATEVDTPSAAATASLDAPTPQAEPTAVPVPYSGTYYDSNSIGPGSAIGRSEAPRRVDPRYEPGQKYIVVERGAGANSRQAMLVSGNRALKLGRYASAVEIFEKLYKKNPRDRAVLMGLAVAQQNSGMRESAITTYERLINISPKNKDALVNLMGLLKDTNPSMAMRRLTKLQDKYPNDPGLAAQIGLVSAEMGNIDDALRYLGVAASIEPSNAGHLYNMAIVSDRAGAHSNAISLYEQALQVDVSHGASRSVPRDLIYDRLAELRRL